MPLFGRDTREKTAASPVFVSVEQLIQGVGNLKLEHQRAGSSNPAELTTVRVVNSAKNEIAELGELAGGASSRGGVGRPEAAATCRREAGGLHCDRMTRDLPSLPF